MGQKVNPHGLRAVSYTHLDVYKRQGLYFYSPYFVMIKPRLWREFQKLKR